MPNLTGNRNQAEGEEAVGRKYLPATCLPPVPSQPTTNLPAYPHHLTTT